jgi:hypothetical protein
MLSCHYCGSGTLIPDHGSGSRNFLIPDPDTGSCIKEGFKINLPFSFSGKLSYSVSSFSILVVIKGYEICIHVWDPGSEKKNHPRSRSLGEKASYPGSATLPTNLSLGKAAAHNDRYKSTL